MCQVPVDTKPPFPLWNGGSPPLRPFHVFRESRGVKGPPQGGSLHPTSDGSYFVHPHFITIGDREISLYLFFDKPWNFPQGRGRHGLGVLPMSRCDVIIPKKKQPPSLYRYNITNRYQNDGHLKGISFQIWLSMLSWVSMLNFRYPTVVIPSPSIPLWKKHFCWWNISF